MGFANGNENYVHVAWLPLMWIKTLMHPRGCSTENSEFFNFSEWCPQVDELLIRAILVAFGV